MNSQELRVIRYEIKNAIIEALREVLSHVKLVPQNWQGARHINDKDYKVEIDKLE